MKRMIRNFYCFTVALTFLAACNNTREKAEITAEEGTTTVSDAQFTGEGMMKGVPSMQTFEEALEVNGYVVAPSNGMAQVNTQVGGIVTVIKYSIADYVRKGTYLCTISSKEALSLQQDYLETTGNLERVKSDYLRRKKMFAENIGAQKDLIAAESEYNAIMARVQGLRSQLKLISIDADKLSNGSIKTSFDLYSPIEGYITSRNVVLGEFAEPQKPLFEIVDVRQLQLQLSVYEKDIEKLKIGQKVNFSLTSGNSQIYSAQILSIGRSIDPQSRTIFCIASISDKERGILVNNAYIKARIIMGTKVSIAVPNEALVKSGDDIFLFIYNGHTGGIHTLIPVKVGTGLVSDKYTEIIGIDSSSTILIKGVANLPTE
jgi:cobalt-zinc-cadmium efflux system membrane fusion protein